MSDPAQTEGSAGAESRPPAWLPLAGDETILWQGGPRIQTVIPAAAVGFALVAAGVVVASGVGPVPESPLVRNGVGALLVLVGVAMPLWTYLEVGHTAYVVTDRGLYRKDGVLSRSVTAVGYETIQNVGYAQEVTGTLFDYGTLDVETAGSEGTELSFADVDDPRAVERLVGERLSRVERPDAGARAIPGTTEQWEAVLGEVVALRRALERPEGTATDSSDAGGSE